jgi:hypothetical protein
MSGTREIISWIAMAKATFNKKKNSFHQQTGLKFNEETSKVVPLEYRMYDAETWMLQKVDQKYLESFEM